MTTYRDAIEVTNPSSDSILSRLGEVQASPTSNTVLDRLKALKTSIDPKVLTHVAIDFSSASAQTIIAAPGAGNRIRLVELDLTALSNVEVAVKSGSTTIRTFQFATLAWAPPIPLNLGTNEALVLDSMTADRITGGVSYYVEDVA